MDDSSAPPQDFRELATTIATLAAAAVCVGAGYAIWGKIPVALHWPALWSSLACYLAGFALCGIAFSPLGPRHRENLAVAGLLFAFVVAAANWVAYAVAYYGTDSLLFNAYAAHLLAHGIDPYTQSMRPAYDLYGVPPSLVTPTTNGEAVYDLSYPALSFLIYLPFELFGLHNMLWLHIAAHAAVLVTLAVLAPRPLKAFAMLPLFADAAYFAYTVGAVTDILWVLPFLFVAYFWRSNPALAAVFLGLACGIKQTPWLVAPFALILWFVQGRAVRDPRAFFVPAATLLGSFLIFELPFILWHPAAWLTGTFKPLAGNLVPFGSGLVQLSTSTIYDIPIERYGLLAAVVLVVSLICFALWTQSLGWLPFVAPALVLFCAARSLHNYFMYWPIVLVAYALRRQTSPAAVPIVRLGRRSAWGAGLAAAVSFGAIAIAFARPHHDDLVARRYNFDLRTHRLASVAITFDNREKNARHLRFGLLRSGVAGALEMLNGGLPETIPPQRTVSLVLNAHGTTFGDSSEPQTVQIVAIDTASGTENWSRAALVHPPNTFLIDPGLTAWSSGSVSAPLGWDIDHQDFASGKVRRVRGRNALAFSLDAPSAAAWSVVAVGQIVGADVRRFRLRIRPYQDYAGNEYPLALFGLELVDALDRHVNYVFSSQVTAPKIYRRSRFVVYVLPCKLGVWNDVWIDLTDLQSDFYFSPEAKMRFNIVAAVHHGSIPRVRGDFGGVFDISPVKKLRQP